MNKADSLGDRMKSYEDIFRIHLTKKTPVIVRIDGRAFHTFTKGFIRPFDTVFMQAMQNTAKYLCEKISGCKLAYVQSDEISLLLTDFDTPETQAWFNNNLQKIVSVTASLATLEFNRQFEMLVRKLEVEPWDIYINAILSGATFDARAFILPKEEVCNYFIWRQQDAARNSIQMVAQSVFSHKELQGKNCVQLQEMLLEKDVDWNLFPIPQQRGACIVKSKVNIQDNKIKNEWVIDEMIPVFTQDKDYINNFVK